MVMSRDESERAAAPLATTASRTTDVASPTTAPTASPAASPYEWTLEVRSAIALFCWWEPDDVGSDAAPGAERTTATAA